VEQEGEDVTGWSPLYRHLLAAAHVLLPSELVSTGTVPSVLLEQLVRAVRRDLNADRLWTLFVAVASRYPTRDEISEGIRAFELSGADDDAALIWLLDTSLEGALDGSSPGREINLVRESVLVDVHFAAHHDLHTGVQEVVRQLLPLWVRDRCVVPVAWTERFGSYRGLTPPELRRVHLRAEHGTRDSISQFSIDNPILLPWNCIIVLPEVPFGDAPDRLSAMAQFSSNHLVAIGHDCIPVVSGDLVPMEDARRFVNYLSMIKHAERVAGVSSSASAEFQGFVETLSTQGLQGPLVVECREPSPPPSGGTRRSNSPNKRPMVLMVGSLEPRKNHLAVLHAAERLWRAGIDFEMTIICGSGWGSEIPDRIEQLTEAGRPLTVMRQADAATLDLAYRTARFSVFPSLHEGFGLPVAESLAAGTPVITSDFGSLQEISSFGGTLMVNPHDDDALEHAMRRLLTDDTVLEDLQKQIEMRPRRDWEDYARELWTSLVQPLLISPSTSAAS
jgi:glycosyltransferase involved in cell wall biosynthesis